MAAGLGIILFMCDVPCVRASQPPRGAIQRKLKVASMVTGSDGMAQQEPAVFFHADAGLAEASEILATSNGSTSCELSLRAAWPAKRHFLTQRATRATEHPAEYLDVDTEDQYNQIGKLSSDVADVKVVGRIEIWQEADGSWHHAALERTRVRGASFRNQTFMVTRDTIEDPGPAMLRAVALAHEYGHTAGLRHMPTAANLMYPWAAASPEASRAMTRAQCKLLLESAGSASKRGRSR